MAIVDYGVCRRAPVDRRVGVGDLVDEGDLHHLTVRLPGSDIERLKRLARREGIGHTTLVRRILHAYLQQAEIGK